MIEKLVWEKDRMLLDDLVFRLELSRDRNWNLGENCFRFFKDKELIDQYARLWSCKRGFHPENVLELGIWDGGSTALWFESFRPKKLVALDIQLRGDSDYFRRYIASRGLDNRIKTYWGTDQADSDRVKAIVANEFSGPLDLVIDDASHLYEPTKTSFETLFPLLRPGGLYILEDWAWAHWEGFDVGAPGSELTQLVFELVEATGSRMELIADLSVFRGFVVAERGGVGISELGKFKIDHHIYRRPKMPDSPADLVHALRTQLTGAGNELRAVRAKVAWYEHALLMIKEANSLIGPRETVLLVDDGQFGEAFFPGRTVIPFLERDGSYWGPPPDDAIAVRELERIRRSGVSFIVFTWPAFWWLEHYYGFRQHLRAAFPCVLENERLVVFDLR